MRRATRSALCLAAWLSVLARACAGAVVFQPGSADEEGFIYRDYGSQIMEGEAARFNDALAFIDYRFAFAKRDDASVVFHLSGQFFVDFSRDGENFQRVADGKSHVAGEHTFDPGPWLNEEGVVFVRVGDDKPEDGWGGKIHQVRLEGALRPLPPPIKPGEFHPRWSESKVGTLYPQLARPARVLRQFCPAAMTTGEAILYRSLQGLVNREHNELVIGDCWGLLPELLQRHWVDRVEVLDSAESLFARYPRRNAVVYDPAQPGSVNLAVMIGAQEGWVVAHPDLVGRHELRIREDLRGRWPRLIDGYREVLARYEGKFNQRVLVMNAPLKRVGLIDFAMAHKTFTFWITGGTDAGSAGILAHDEEQWFERVLGREFPVNIPVLGYPQAEPVDGIGENRGVALLSRCAKFLVPSDHLDNLTILSSFPPASPAPAARKSPARARPEADKVYVAMVLSDGDNLCLWNGPRSFMFGYMRQLKGDAARRFPVGYSIGPSVGDLLPLAATMISESFDARDSLGGAISGVGYIYPRHYAAAFGDQRGKVVAAFTDLTNRYLAKAGLKWSSAMDYGGPCSGVLEPFLRNSPCVALMGGYGREVTDAAKTTEKIGEVAVFHSVSRMAGADEVLADILQVTEANQRPLFLYAFIVNWSVSPAACRDLAERLANRGIELVDPETLAQLSRDWCDERAGAGTTSPGG